MTRWTEPYEGKLIGFVVKTKVEHFVSIIGRCVLSDGDDDCVVWVSATTSQKPTLEEALVLLDVEKDRLYRIFRKPVSAPTMEHWLVPLVISEDGTDPRSV